MAVKFTIEAAQAARDAILADIEATQPRVLPGIDAQALALGLGQLVNGLSDRQRGRLAAFDGQEGYRALMIDELGKAAQTLWLTVTERNAAKDGSVPVVDLKTLAEEGRALRRTLTETLEYNLRGNAAARSELASIRKGRGYRDLAEDLQRLVLLARQHDAIIGRDPHHDPASLDAADALAGQILAQVNLADPSKAEQLATLQRKTQGYLVKRYRVLRALAGFVFRDESVGERFATPATLAGRGQLT